ncbi:MAG: gliding motility-associated C-terminal domain-containing protein [Bacteroidia bacterium]
MSRKYLHIVFLLVLLCNFSLVYSQFRITENAGQWDESVLFQSNLLGTKLYVTNGGLTYLFYNSDKVTEYQHNTVQSDSLEVHVVKIDFLNSNPDAIYSGLNAYPDYSNYFIGDNPKRWKGKVKSYNKLYVSDIYPNIDFELFQSEKGLKYNFIVRPGGDPTHIKMEYRGADSLRIINGALKVYNRFGSITELQPLVFEGNTEKAILPSAYKLENSVLSFEIGAKRNLYKNLIIDPILVFSTYSGSLADNFGYTATFDTAGHGYAGGTVFGIGFPTTTGAYQMQFAGGTIEDRTIGYISRDCGIMKYSKDGKSLLFSTYIGGVSHNEQPHSMIVDSKNNLLVMGTTKSSDFPIGITPSYDPNHNGLSDIFVVKFTEDGSDLIAGTFIGGKGYDGLNGDRPSNNISPLLYNYADDFRGEIIVDSSDDVYVSSTTNSDDFPVKFAFDADYSGRQDGCVFKLSGDLSNLLFSSFIGGTGDDAAYGIDLGTHNDLYVTGGSNSSSFNYPGPGLNKNNNGGRADGYLLRVNLSNFTLMASTFIGTPQYDQSYFVKTDKYGKPFIYGQTEGNHSVSADVYSNKDAKMFLKKLSFNCDAIEIETTFGGLGKTRPDLSPTALLVDECERIFISGWGGINFADGFIGGGTKDMPLKDPYQDKTDGYDFYLAVFSKSMQELQYATYFGGLGNSGTPAHEHVDGGTSRFDKKGIIYQSVCAGCGRQSLFPTSPGVWSNTNKSQNCNNALFKFDFENLNRKPQAKDSFYDVFATDTLDFEILVSDPDRSDSLRIVLESDIFSDPNFPQPLPEIVALTPIPGQNAIRARILWYPNCAHVGLDTIVLNVKVYDQGCPTQDSNEAKIRIVVKDPPLTLTPETFCLFFNQDGSVKLSWKAFEKNRFFSYILLHRVNPNGSSKVLDTIFNSNAGEFKDKPPSNAQTANFQYYMVGYNICNKPYDAGLRINTTKEFNSPIDSTYIHYATVEDNKFVRINWFTSKEEDFGSYDVYRAYNIDGKSSSFLRIKTLYDANDTDFVDTDVKVDTKSYCYKIGVNDKCGHVSNPSNEACNIVLQGDVGHLYFDLDWIPYREWAGRVNNYELERRVDTGSLRKLANTDLLRVHHDDDLDLWWGAYYYVVRAYEGKTKAGFGYGATSLSNEIRLIQPPIVFVPNAFSPNDDYSNDVWGVSHAFVREYKLQVFNRWGEKVWENDFKGNQWDGTTRGKGAKNDVFIWIITYKGWDNKFHTQKGTVTVMP